MCLICGIPSSERCNCNQVYVPYCDQCNEDNRCVTKLDAQCVIYHFNTEKPSQLSNLNFTNGASVEEILEKIDSLISSSFNIPITPVSSSTVNLIANGVSNHTIEAEVKISTEPNNQIEVRSSGLHVKPYNENYWVKVNSDGSPAYLQDKIEGGTDGCVSITTSVIDDQVRISPKLDILCLLRTIKEDYPDAFCELVNDICQKLGWVVDDVICLVQDIQFDMVNSGTDLPEPANAFIDNGIVYFVSDSNNTGKVWTINPYTYINGGTITYINETRTGQPYGTSGGTYVASAPYKGNAEATYTSPARISGSFYDESTRTLFVQGSRTYGCDYYDFISQTWGKVTDPLTTGYNTTHLSDAYIFGSLSSNKNTNLLLAGWGTDSSNAGTKILVIDKVLRKVSSSRDTLANPISGFSSNPFNRNWVAFISASNDIIVGKGQTEYRNIAILDQNLAFKQELVLPISTSGYSSQTGVYWQNSFYDNEKDKIYLNDYLGRVLYVYSKTGSAYTLTKTFNFANKRNFAAVQVLMKINPISNELFWDMSYGDTSATYNPNGSADALESERISYKVNRDTLAIEAIYIGQLKASNLIAFPNGDALTVAVGTINPNSPQKTGSFNLSQASSSQINTGIVHATTLKEINLNSLAPTGNTKPNVIGDPDYIADYQDLVQCPLSYTMDCPDGVIISAVPAQAVIEFGLGPQVVSNPAISKIRATFKVSGVQKGTIEWSLPNTPNTNAFFGNVNLTGVVAGNSLTVDLDYLNSSNTSVHTCSSIATTNVTT